MYNKNMQSTIHTKKKKKKMQPKQIAKQNAVIYGKTDRQKMDTRISHMKLPSKSKSSS